MAERVILEGRNVPAYSWETKAYPEQLSAEPCVLAPASPLPGRSRAQVRPASRHSYLQYPANLYV